MKFSRLLLGLALSTAVALPAMATSYQYRAYVPGMGTNAAPPPVAAVPLAFSLGTATLPTASRGFGCLEVLGR